MVRILAGQRQCSSQLDSLSFFMGVIKSITSERYEQVKKDTDLKSLISLDDTFWGNKSPSIPDKILMMQRGELENLPHSLFQGMIDEAKANIDTEVEQYLIHSLVHGLNHSEIISKSNWRDYFHNFWIGWITVSGLFC